MQRGHQIDSRSIAYLRHVYDGEAADMRHLYEQAKLDQWNAATDIDDETAIRKFFRRDLHAGLVRNMRKLGALTPRVSPDLEALGISLAAA